MSDPPGRRTEEDHRDRHHRRSRHRGQARRAADRRRPAHRHLHPALLLPRAHGVGGHVPHVPRRRRHRPRPGPGGVVHDQRDRGHEGRHLRAAREEGPRGRARVPAHQPPARLPGVRQGRRVPVAGPDAQPRTRREPVRGGEAPLRQAHPDQRARVPRPRALHPLRPLHPLRQGRGRRSADQLHAPGQPDADPHLPRRAVRLVLQRQHRADLPRRCARPPSPSASRPGRGTCRSWRARARRAPSGCRITVESSRDQILRYQGVDDDPVNWGWMCDRGRFNFEAVGSEDRLGAPLLRKPGADGDELVEASWAEAIDAAAAAIRERPRRRWARRRSPSSAAPAAPTRTPTPGPSWPRASSAPTTSTPSSATACRPRPCSACRRPPSTRSAPPPRSCCSGRTSKRSCPVLYLRLRDAAERRTIRILELSERDTGLTPLRLALAAAPSR